MSDVRLDVPEDTAVALKVPQEALGRELTLAAAVKLYEIGRLSSGAAARLAGLPKPVFLAKLAAFGVNTFDMTEGELQREFSRD